jgi:hypothetical protein
MHAQGSKVFGSYYKAIHVVSRRCHGLPYGIKDLEVPILGGTLANYTFELTDLQYIGTLSGRGQDLLLANDGEVESRTKMVLEHPLVGTNPSRHQQEADWCSALTRHFDLLGSQLRQNMVRHADYKATDWQASFISQAPLGSVTGGKDIFSNFMSDTHNVHKRLWLDSVPLQLLLDFTDPEQVTQAQAKTETMKKLRQIFPGPVQHWAKETMAINHAERVILGSSVEFSLSHTAWQRMADHQARLKRIAKRCWTVASDYSNFNWLHTVRDMKLFWLRIFKYVGPEVPQAGDWDGIDYRSWISRAADWLANSLDYIYIRPVSGSGKYIHVLRGLLSGWRTTTLINNTMNFVYSNILREQATTLLGYTAITWCRINGDDSDMVATSVFSALVFLTLLSLAELDVQASKQLICDNAAEYLRIWYDDAGIRGNSMRSISSFISSDLQAPKVDSSLSFVRGTCDACHLLRRRGCDPVLTQVLQDVVLLHYAQISYTDMLGERHTVKLANPTMLYCPIDKGGWGCTLYGQPISVRPSSTRQWPKARLRWSLENAPHYAAKSMLTKLHDTLVECNLSTDIVPNIWPEIVSAATQGVDTAGIHNEDNWLRMQTADHVRWQNSLSAAKIEHLDYTNSTPFTQVVCTSLNDVLNLDGPEVISMKVPHPALMAEEAAARALGLAAITPGVLNMLTDASTGERISIIELYRRKGITAPTNFSTVASWGAQVSDLAVWNVLDWPTELCGAIPADYLPAVTYAQQRVVREFFRGTGNRQQDATNLHSLLEQTNNVIATYFPKRYGGYYRF